MRPTTLLIVTLLPLVARAQTLPPKDVLDLSMRPPALITNPGPRYADATRDYNMIIGLEHAPGGRLLCCWVSGGDSDKGYFVLASSDDGGKTWSTPRLVIDPPDHKDFRVRTLVGNLWCDPTGRLWLFFDLSVGKFDGRDGDWATVCENPDAAEPKWSAPSRIWHGATLNKPTVLKNGDWLLPISLWTRNKIGPKEFKDAYPELDEFRMANVFVSTNKGHTWSRRGGARFPGSDFDEHMIVERKDGSLWMLARTKDGIAESVSTDGGKTWSEGKPSTTVASVNARFFLRRLASGRLLLVKHGAVIDKKPQGRRELTAFLSDDDGQTWKGGLVIYERPGVSYPDGLQAPDGLIHIAYDRNRADDREILMAVFTEADVLAGKTTGEKSRLKSLVNKATGAKIP
ncbi:MAG TPA: sialidase family protein [Tepidisphaeraceae bacterium]|nr:sialidase family protein [Tepidisphaeraceae bacterium]